MKRVAYILVLLSCFGFEYIHAESGQTFAFQVFSSLNKSDKDFTEKPSCYSLSTVVTGDSDQNSFGKKKRKRKRGIKPALISVSCEFDFKIIDFEIEIVCSPQSFYFFRPCFAHGERGPPQPL